MAPKKVHISRFTPSLMDHETLEAIFVQREDIAIDTVDRIRESVLNGNKHYMLFVGPRGCGKTHFVSLVFHRLKRIEDLRDELRVAWLNEDKTSTSVLDLNRRIYETLSADYPDEFPKNRLDALYDRHPSDATIYMQELLNERLGDKSALIIIENLDALFENFGRQGQHDWRAFLQESGKFTILATAQQLFPGVSDRNLPFYGFFQTAYLKPLSVQGGRQLLKNIATQQEDTELAGFLDTPEGRSRVRTLHHLSGGNHRVYVVFSEFINRKSLDELVTPFEKTLDELTPYYQERLRWLTPQQRMIVEHLCTCDRALPVKEIARALFASNQTISKQLTELKQKRYVRSAKRGRESLYELTEPLMRLAMELKENRGGPIRLIVDFLRVWYSREELQNRLRSLPDTERMERIHVESAIAQIDCGAENLRVRALLADIGELAHRGDEQGIIDAVSELAAAAGTADYGRTAERVWRQLEIQYPPLRLGAPFSDEGIPPQLVFLPSPPRPPQDAPKDECPPPPVAGEAATLDMGYNEEDLRVLALVGDYRFGSIMRTVPDEWPTLPQHGNTTFDEGDFVRNLRRSISLSIDEKHRILAAIPNLSQYQIDEFQTILKNERSKFSSLSPKHLLQLRQLERTHAQHWCEWLCKGIESANARSWLDAHATGEVNDILSRGTHQVPQDDGPPPPAPGEEATSEMGFDDDDLRTLALVGDYRYGSVMATVPDDWPPLPPRSETTFDERAFMFALSRSISLNIDQKQRIFATFPQLSQFQFNELLKVLAEEQRKFSDLSPKHLLELRKRERQHARDWCEWICSCKESAAAKSWLDVHAKDEIADLRSAAEVSENNDLFPKRQQVSCQLAVVGWYLRHRQQEFADSWISRARRLVEVVEDDPMLVDLLKQMGSQLRRWRQYDAALQLLDEALVKAPTDGMIHTERGWCLSGLQRPEAALLAHTKAVEFDDKKLSYRINRAAELVRLQRADEALEECDLVVERDPGFVQGWEGKARALQELRRYEDALVANQEAINRANKRADLWLVRGFIFDEAGEFAEAANSYAKGIELDPNHAGCLNNRAVSLYRLRRYDEALASVTESLRLRPNDAHAKFTRIEILLSTGQWHKGWAEAERCLQQYPPQNEPIGAERYLIQIILQSTQELELWTERIARLCDLFRDVDALTYVGEGLVRTLRFLADDPLPREIIGKWQSAWHTVGHQYDELAFSLRLFDAGIEYLKTREPNVLLHLPVEQRAILEQLFDIDVTHDD